MQTIEQNSLQRLKQYIDYKGINISNFEKSVGFSNGSLAGQIKKNKTIGVDKLEYILKVYPDLSAAWLLTGSGDMIATGKSQQFMRDMDGMTKEEMTDLVNILKNSPNNVSAGAKNKATDTIRQAIIKDDHFNQLRDEVRNIQGDLEGLLLSIEAFEKFRDVSEELSEKYIDRIYQSMFDNDRYLKGRKFDYQSYRIDVMTKLNELKEFNKPLQKLTTAINQFYNEISRIDTEKVLENFNH